MASLSSANPAASVPPSVTVAASSTSANFTVSTSTVSSTTLGNITASYSGVTKTSGITVQPQIVALSSLTLSPSVIIGGSTTTGTVNLTGPAPAGGIIVNLSSNKPTKASVPPNVTVAAGANSANFTVTTTVVNKNISASISASYAGVKKSATLTIQKRPR